MRYKTIAAYLNHLDACKNWQKNNPERYRIIQRRAQKKYNENNPGLAAARHKKWQEVNREKCRESCRKYHALNREKIKARNRERYLLKKLEG